MYEYWKMFITMIWNQFHINSIEKRFLNKIEIKLLYFFKVTFNNSRENMHKLEHFVTT